MLRAIALLSLLVPAAAHAQSERDVARRVHDTGGYGDRLPLGGEYTPDDEYSPGDSGGSSSGSAPAPHSAPVQSAATGISWVVIAIAIALFAALLIAVLLSVRPRDEPSTKVATKTAPPLPGVAPPGEVSLGDPDALANAGRFEEAIAAALHHGLVAVGWKPEGIGKSRTAREILASVKSDDGTLAGLVGIEERVAFGGDEADATRWAEARSLWVALVSRGRR